MKKLLIVFLIFIFSMQGTVAAVGADVVSPLQGQEHVCSIGSCLDSVLDEADGQQVPSNIEELSDYMALHVPVSKPPHLVALAAVPTVIHLSTVLPRVKRPPRLPA
ncbi:MAG TPA: hypothetical protein VEC01_05185 [Noviherbaspirillum sp.]|uniref:hypothetical protein n=1 Tax=Noviherbaspirillum sp. TaxID=1926288 RepID=UPI002D5FACD7|nr:hypothetical protein [Noviherbaspirillum sp.]HYD94699.1 hypothetical protein [Noviherbaspirillum sp.]